MKYMSYNEWRTGNNYYSNMVKENNRLKVENEMLKIHISQYAKDMHMYRDLFYKERDSSSKNNITIKKVHFNNPVTCVIWSDGTKTLVRAQNEDVYDPEKGLAMAIAKKALGNTSAYYDVFKQWVDDE